MTNGGSSPTMFPRVYPDSTLAEDAVWGCDLWTLRKLSRIQRLHVALVAVGKLEGPTPSALGFHINESNTVAPSTTVEVLGLVVDSCTSTTETLQSSHR